MESVLRRSEIDLETLKPPTRKLSSFSSYIPHRIHFDSSSYRSLVRILSHCVNHSLVPISSAPESTVSVKEPISSIGRGNRHEDQEAGVNTDWGTSAARQEGDRRADGGVQRVSADGVELVGLDLSDFDEKEIEACVNSEELRSVMLECGRLIDAPNEERNVECHEGNRQAVREEIVHNELGIAGALVNGAEEIVSDLREVSEVSLGDWTVYNSLKEAENTRKIALDIDNLVSSEPSVDTDYENAILVETKNENSNGAEEKGQEKKQQTDFDSTSLVDYSGLRNFNDGQVRTLAHQIDVAEVEEGEISDDAQDLEGLLDINDSETVPEDQKKEGPSRDDFNKVASSAIRIHKKEVSELGVNLLETSEDDSTDKANQSKRKVVEDRRKKGSTLTEERKAKKKIAKKRKRAQKNREQGVKKLKLHANLKPKEVKYCNFYLMGRCQQGNLCKFSHDTTPLTKSMPCKYFACNSCLRGDDCPYDHELSKYPCHNHLSTGSCIRGDGCKFSHKIPTTDAASQLTASKIDLHSTSKQPKLRNQPVGVHVSPPDTGRTKEAPPLLKEANRVPKGIRFISFGTAQADFTSKAKGSLPVKQVDMLVHGHQSAWKCLPPKNSVKSSGLVGDVSSNGFGLKDSGNVPKGSPVTHPGGTANHEVSEATKILEEFLFCGAG